ncbi:MAG: peptidoglycan DD-metalloendopeptidase family protein [Candidatus Parcubacteria bacterium]|nr:peptidoglycan DD-metalloendopeptidase family protein [Candidatus Parcubacteria bacterium]
MQLSKIRSQVSDHLKELQSYKDTLTKQKEKSESQKRQLAGYQSQLTDQKVVLDIAKKEKNDLLLVTKNREVGYQKILDANLAKKQAFEKELADYEAQLTKQLDKKYIPVAGIKILSWPLENPVITQHFGVTKDSVRLYASGAHNGIDLRASVGTKLLSPAQGTVIGTGDTDVACPKASYGKWVLIKHDNGLTTLMAHFSLIKVSQGQQVSTGDLIGYSGNTGYSTGPHLHISVFASDGVTVGTLPSKSCSGRTFTMPLPTVKNAYLDPEAYLPNL